jgi:hypothetical protein
MARQRLYGKMIGTVDDLTFYKGRVREGSAYLVRDKGGVSAERIATDPAFQRTRENNADFGTVGRFVKSFLGAARPAMSHALHLRAASRLMRLAYGVMQEDMGHVRGQREVQSAVLVSRLPGFNFGKAQMTSVAGVVLTDSFASGTEWDVTVPAHDSLLQIEGPVGATHYRFLAGTLTDVAVNFHQYTASPVAYGAYRSVQAGSVPNEVIAVSGDYTGPEVVVVLVGIEFYQLQGSVYYPMKNANYNACKVLSMVSA